ncbi:helix-turn-helix domain-containing protein [Exiguobacterium antarcticum]|uniref:helix-turn-helix domain-containing protein n=1 Tax=Exiguobacterium antarcticum TaxID=132920 RepID=UPI0009D9317E
MREETGGYSTITIFHDDRRPCVYLTRASKHLQISQPALSQLVREFEELEQVELFLRHHGRLTGCTDINK